MDVTNEITQEIVIVGSRYGDFTDVLKPYYEKGEPIEQKEIKKLLGTDMVYLQPVSNNDDPYAVGVFITMKKRLGFVWKDQSPSLREHMAANNKKLYKAQIKRINTRYGLMMAEATLPDKLPNNVCRGLDIDEDWANNIPETVISITEQSLNLGFAMLCDELPEMKQWNDTLENRFTNLKQDLPADLSGHHIMESRELYDKMKASAIKEVRESCDEMLHAYVSRGSKENMKRWANIWLPQFFREFAESGLLGLFEAANYTLERVEALLDQAPAGLFFLYKYNRERFAFHLYYAALPQKVYNRLLTLRAVREAMLEKMNGKEGNLYREEVMCDEELFHFIHPEVEHEEAIRIHQAIKRAVAYQRIPEICTYLKELKQKGKVMLPPTPNFMYNELVRLGMPTGKGYGEKYFARCYAN